MQDLATKGIQSYPCKTKSAQETQRNQRKFFRPEENTTSIDTGNSLECTTVCEEVCWNHKRSTPHRSETHGNAERAVRRVLEGTSSVFLFSLDCKKVGGQKPWSVTTMSEMRKTYQQSAKTLYDSRFSSPLDGPIIPPGTELLSIPNH